MSVSSSVGQRFSQLIQQLGMSKNAFAMSLDKTATVIQHLVDERNKPGFDLMNKVFEVYPNVSVDWLLRGYGPMLRDSPGPVLAAVATPPATAAGALPQPRGVPATPVFPEPLFTVSVAS
ncbi:MAG: XRE family transcriptional regulator, partial [Hymenobacter sp.]